MALLVEMGVIDALMSAILSRRYHRHRLLLDNEVHEAVEIISAVGDDVVTETISKQGLRLRDVMSVTAS